MDRDVAKKRSTVINSVSLLIEPNLSANLWRRNNFLGTIGTNSPWITNLKLNQTSVSFKIDSGADVSVKPYKSYQSIHQPVPLLSTRKLSRGPCNRKLDVKGTFKIRLQHGNCATEEEMFVVDGLERAFLGRQAAQRLHLINRVESITTLVTKAAMQSEYLILFTGLGQMKGQEYDIKLTENATTFAINVPKQVPIYLSARKPHSNYSTGNETVSYP